MLWRGIEIDEHECMDAGGYGVECSGEVTVQFSAMGTPNPRCEAHWERRFQSERRIRQYECALPPDDFDPTDAGERWDDDY